MVDARLAVPREPRFFSAAEFETLHAVCARIVPQPDRDAAGRDPIPVAALLDDSLHKGETDGYRTAPMPRRPEAWRRGLRALDHEAEQAHGMRFHGLGAFAQDQILAAMEAGKLSHASWEGMPPDMFFKHRMGREIVQAYYSHPTAWNEVGFGGPASPRGYVRLGFNRRDAWEPVEAKDGDQAAARRENQRVR